MSVSIKSRLKSCAVTLSKAGSAAALALGLGLLAPAAYAQHHGGGGGGGGGGCHGGGGGYHGGGGFHGGGGYHGGWGGHGWGGWHGGWGGYGWGGWYGGWYPGFGVGLYDPFWYGDYYDYAPPVAYAPAPVAPDGYDGPAAPPPASYGPQQQGYAPVTPSATTGEPTDNRRGFYTWAVGVENGSCNRPYLAQVASRLTGLTPVGLRDGATLGGIPVDPVIDGKIGPRLDVVDQACAMESLERARTGTSVAWQTSAGIPVTFEATRSYTLEDGRRCREFTATARFASHTETVNGLACRNNGTGAWELSR
jgi:hypothetical protein